MAKRTPSEVVLSPYLICRHRFRHGHVCRDSPPSVSSVVKGMESADHPRPTYLAQCVHCDAWGLNVSQVPFCIILEVIGGTEPGERPGQVHHCLLHPVPPTRFLRPDRHLPQSLLPAPQVVLHDDTSHCAAFAHAGSIPDQETSALPTGQQDLMLLWVNRGGSGLGGLVGAGGGGGDGAGYLAGIGDGFQLQSRQGPIV